MFERDVRPATSTHGFSKSRQETAGENMAPGQLIGTVAPKDISPVEVRLMHQQELLTDLAGAVSVLLNSIRPAMRFDPRDQPTVDPKNETNKQPVACQLESEIAARNEELFHQVTLLRQAQEAICL